MMDDCSSGQLPNGRVSTLIEALPYMRQWSGKTMVVKYGGAAMSNPQLQHSVMKDLVLLHYLGVRIVLVHGGGPRISDMMERLGHQPQFINGLRVTDRATMDIVQMVLVGSIGQDLVSLINSEGGKAVGVSGKDAGLIVADRKQSPDGDLGFVGEVNHIETHLIDTLNEAGYMVVLTPLGTDKAGNSYNINADTVACAVAEALQAEKLVILSDVPGVLRDVEDESSLISVLTTEDVRRLVAANAIAGGMIPKVEAAMKAVLNGVRRVHLIDGRREHSLLLELFTEQGIGTMITVEGDFTDE